MLPFSLKASLIALEVIALATLVRSVLVDRWITVAAAIVLIAGAIGTRYAQTWGVGVILAAASAFLAAAAIGIAPMWFWGVGLAGVVPFVLVLRPMVRFDRGATALYAFIATGAGTAAAFAWREIWPFLTSR